MVSELGGLCAGSESGGLLLAEDNASFAQVVGGKLDLDAIAWEDADKVLAHLSRNNTKDYVVGIVQLQLEHCIGQCHCNGRFHFNWLRFGHSRLQNSLVHVSGWVRCQARGYVMGQVVGGQGKWEERW